MLPTERIMPVAEVFAEDLWDVLTGQSESPGQVDVNLIKDDVCCSLSFVLLYRLVSARVR
jgi:hypothetical protein